MDVKSIDFEEQFEKLGKVPKAARYGAVAAILALVGAGYYFLLYTDAAGTLASQRGRSQELQRKLTNVRAVANNVGPSAAPTMSGVIGKDPLGRGSIEPALGQAVATQKNMLAFCNTPLA